MTSLCKRSLPSLAALALGALVASGCSSSSKTSTASETATTSTVAATTTTVSATTTVAATTTTAAAVATAAQTTNPPATNPPATSPPGPQVSASFSGPDCSTLDPLVTVSWQISAGAEVMYVAVDNVNGKYDDIAASGSITFTFACDGYSHTYYVVAEKGGIRTVKSKSFIG